MRLYLSKITRLVGGSLQLDFGNINQYTSTNAKGKIRQIERGEYRLQFFDCSWRFVKDEKILYGCFDYEDDDELNLIDSIQYHDIQLLSLKSINIFDQKLLFSNNSSVDIFPASKSVYTPIYYFTDSNNEECDITKFIDIEI